MEEPGIFSKYYDHLWIVYSVVWSIIFLLGFIPFMFPYLLLLILPLTGCLLYLDPKTRIHGFFFLISSAYFWGNLFLSMNVYGLPIWEFHILAGWSMLLIDFLPKSLTMLISFNFFLLFPILILELGHWVWGSLNWQRGFIAGFILLAFCGFGVGYQNACANQYQKVYPLRGQNLSQEELFQLAGRPVYSRTYDHRYGYYINGEEMIAVKFYNDGTCHVSTRKSWFLD